MVAARMTDVEFSGTIKYNEKVKILRVKLQAEGKPDDIISLTLGEPDFATPQHIIDAAVQALNAKYTHYTSPYGIPELRDAIAAKSQDENKIHCERKNVMVTPTKHAIFSAIMSLVDEGDEVMLPDPCWVSYVPCLNLVGAKPIFIKTDEANGFAVLPDKVNEAITPKTKMIILNSPSNPTGNVAKLDELKCIADLAIDHDLLVLADEIYEKIIFEGEHHSIAALPNMFERTITVNGFSKSYAMTGWRLGWAVAPEPLLNELAKIQQHSITCCTSFAQHGGVTALKGDQQCILEMVEQFKARRDLAVEGLNKIEGVHCTSPQGAFYVFFGLDLNMSSEEFVELLIEHAHMALTPGSLFGPSGEGFVRMSCAASQDTLGEGIERIAGVIDELKN
ncbi:MAG: pyridoxal phosphate-dependent aminotransferase [Thermoplasmata archaeon]|nr:pyridoxal phosphate-dependent aminotransferase [Thermoplasmata archaeon]